MVWPQTEPFVERFSREALVLWPRASRLGVLPPEFAISRLRAALDEVEAGRAPSEASLAGSKDVSSLLKVCTARLDPSLELLELAARPGVSASSASSLCAVSHLARSPCQLPRSPCPPLHLRPCAQPEAYAAAHSEERSVLQVYIEQGALQRHDDDSLVGLLSMTLMAAVFNTQVSLAWILVHLYSDPELCCSARVRSWRAAQTSRTTIA